MKAKSSGIDLCSCLFIIFLVLKLIGTITWSWWWVTAPLWIPAIASLFFFIIYLIVNVCLKK